MNTYKTSPTLNSVPRVQEHLVNSIASLLKSSRKAIRLKSNLGYVEHTFPVAITGPVAQFAVDKGDQAVLELERDGHIRNWRVVISDEEIICRE